MRSKRMTWVLTLTATAAVLGVAALAQFRCTRIALLHAGQITSTSYYLRNRGLVRLPGFGNVGCDRSIRSLGGA